MLRTHWVSGTFVYTSVPGVRGHPGSLEYRASPGRLPPALQNSLLETVSSRGLEEHGESASVRASLCLCLSLPLCVSALVRAREREKNRKGGDCCTRGRRFREIDASGEEPIRTPCRRHLYW